MKKKTFIMTDSRNNTVESDREVSDFLVGKKVCFVVQSSATTGVQYVASNNQLNITTHLTIFYEEADETMAQLNEILQQAALPNSMVMARTASANGFTIRSTQRRPLAASVACAN
jgi:hypothetical protein